MARFAKPARQAASVMKKLQGKHIRSVGTVRNYEQILTRVASWTQIRDISGLRAITPEQATAYLAERSIEIGQKTLDMERQALQAMMRHVTEKLEPSQCLPTSIKSQLSETLQSRSYHPDQIAAIAAHQQPQNGLATEIAYAAGLRAHELLTLAPASERGMDPRKALDAKFQGLSSIRYTVEGKGGLVREVAIPNDLAARLEARRLAHPITVTDRGIHYSQRYDIGGGKPWSNSYSAASKRILGWSAGAHGVRHTYAQERMATLQRNYPYEKALEIVSQEMGHFRPSITLAYLR